MLSDNVINLLPVPDAAAIFQKLPGISVNIKKRTAEAIPAAP
jgi:hypothetical protein